jgi:hypothetical protein
MGCISGYNRGTRFRTVRRRGARGHGVERRWHITIAFWRWCYDHGISGSEIARLTDFSEAFVNKVRRYPQTTVSDTLKRRIEAAYALPDGVTFFVPHGTKALPGSREDGAETQAMTIGRT